MLTLLAGILMGQLSRLQAVLPQLEAAATQALRRLGQWLDTISQGLPAGLQDALGRILADPAGGAGLLGQKLMEQLPQLAAKLAGRLSSGLFGLLTGIISGYMLAGRLDRIRTWWTTHLPAHWHSRYLPALQKVRASLGGWLLAELKLAAVAFGLLLVGLWILGIPHTPVLAGLITIVDAFPVLGVGTVLIPWSLVCLLQENYAQGFGLLGLYGAIWLIRSVLDPLVTLVAIYAGWRLFGIVGMLFSPILAMMASQIVQAFHFPER